MDRMSWSKTEKSVAKKAFDTAYERECKSFSDKVRAMAEGIQDSEDLWRLCDFLNEKRRETEAKYDYRYSALIFVFARLLREGWITPEDLEGISQEKREKIDAIAHARWRQDE